MPKKARANHKKSLSGLSDEAVRIEIRKYVKTILTPGQEVARIRKAVLRKFDIVEVSLGFGRVTKKGHLYRGKSYRKFAFAVSFKARGKVLRSVLG